VQVINRVGWDGAIKPPDPNELSFKDTVRMNPLEDVIVALTPMTQDPFPFPVPNSVRPLNVVEPVGTTSATAYTNMDPTGQPAAVVNDMVNFGWEYVWHCHILGHEENDMMRAMILAVPPNAPTNVRAVGSGTNQHTVTWSEAPSPPYTGFTIQRSTSPAFPVGSAGTASFTVGPTPLTYIDTVPTGGAWYYRAMASNLVGYTRAYAAPAAGYPNVSSDSAWSGTLNTAISQMISPTPGSTLAGTSVRFTWSAGTGVTTTYLWIGTTPGGYDLVNFGGGSATSWTPTNLPTTGALIYVRLWSLIGGVLQYTDYTYGTIIATKAAMTSPTPGTTLSSSSVQFTWTAGTGVTTTYLWIGTTPGSYNLVNFGGVSVTSWTATNLPTNGAPLYARLWSLIGGVLQYTDYTYTATRIVNSQAAMLSPTPGTTIPGTSATFTWSAGVGVSTTYLWIGTGLGTYNLVNFGGGSALSWTATLPPPSGSVLYVRLWSRINGVLLYTDYTYTH
jgi:hypothetical protein